MHDAFTHMHCYTLISSFIPIILNTVNTAAATSSEVNIFEVEYLIYYIMYITFVLTTFMNELVLLLLYNYIVGFNE